MTNAVQAAQEILGSVAPIPQEAEFGEGGEQVDFLPAPWLERLAEKLIREYHELRHLRNETIIYLWKREGGKNKGQATMGKCTKAAGLVKHFSDAGWVIWLAADWANDIGFDRRQVEALLYHEVSHIGLEMTEDDDKVVAVDHDFQGFVSEVRRYGDWMAGLKECKKAWEQAPLIGLREAAEALVPEADSGIDSVTFSDDKGHSVTLDGETRRKIEKMQGR